MDHTYLRYECADSFGLTVAAASSKAPVSVDQIIVPGRGDTVLAVTGSTFTCWSSKGLGLWKWGHRNKIGTGQSLNSDELVCIDVSIQTNGSMKVATGWFDGAVRIMDFEKEDDQYQMTHSLLDKDNYDFPEPLELRGHSNSPVRCVVFDKNTTRLASGGSNGAIILWDLVAESGLFRLLGHKGAIKGIHFQPRKGSTQDFIVSSSMDGLVKVWNLNEQCCTQTIANHQVSSGLCHVFHDDRCRLVTGGLDGQLRVWSVNIAANTPEVDEDTPCQYMGRLSRPVNAVVCNEKVVTLRAYSGRYFGVLQANSKIIDIFLIRSPQECERKRNRRLKRRQEKKKKGAVDVEKEGAKRGLLDEPVGSDEEPAAENKTEENLMDPSLLKATDEFEHLATVRSHHKIRSFCFGKKHQGERLRIVCALSTNSMEIHVLKRRTEDDPESLVNFEKLNVMDFYGHETGIRSVVLSSDDRIACTVSKSATKIWNVASRSCIQSLSPERVSTSKGCYGLCAVFLPGSTHVVVGTREGYIVMIDIASGNIVKFEEDAHDGAIWSVDVKRPTADDPSIHLLTGSADKSVKFWSIEADDDKNPRFVHTRTLQMTDDVIAAKYSKTPEYSKRLVFVSTLDSTIKVFFDDSLKLFLSLYGHKLPALAVDCTDDDMLLASSGADKTVKIWGLDFGDTHKTLLGHDDSVTDLKFVRGTHNFFSCSKDGSIRYWDGDRFEQILLIEGHFAEVSSIAIARTGAFVLSAGMDRQIRVLERTTDIVFLQEERDRELDGIFDKESGREEGDTSEILDRNRFVEENDNTRDPDESRSDAAVKRSVLSIAAGDRIMEALELADHELQALRTHGKQQRNKATNPMMLGKDPAEYVHWVLQTVKSSELDQSLVVLSTRHAERLLYYLVLLLRKGSSVELCSRVAVFLASTFQHQIIGNQTMAPIIRELKRLLHLRLSRILDVAGYDLVALKMMSRIAVERRRSYSFQDDLQVKDIWSDLGLGSDVAAALEGKNRRR